MPKIKTRKSAKKRFKITSTGKVMHRAAGKRHIFESKSPKRKRQARKWRTVDKTDMYRIKRMLPGML